jgi:hypothetical protein
VSGSRPWVSDVSKEVREATNGEGHVVCSKVNEKYDFNFDLGGQELLGHVPSWESVHLAQGLQVGQGYWSQERKLYKLQFELARALVGSSCDMVELWHRRMAHLHHGALSVLKQIVTGLPNFNTKHHDMCKGCALGKYSKIAFPGNDSKSRGILDLIHSDVCGPMSSVSLTGYEYYVTFIEDDSRKWIYFMKTNDEVLSRFQEFKALVENQTRRKIKTLRYDNGGEYTSKAFKDFCAGAGIKRELTVPYNLQRNKVAERKNRAIVGVAKAILFDQDVPMFLWAKACNTAVYIQNKSPHMVLGRKTPEEVFTEKKLEVGHF